MIVKSMRMTMQIPWAQSLKDKRMVVKSILTKVIEKFNVSAAEVEYQDLPKTAVLAVVCVAANQGQADSILEHVLCFVENRSEGEITSIEYDNH